MARFTANSQHVLGSNKDALNHCISQLTLDTQTPVSSPTFGVCHPDEVDDSKAFFCGDFNRNGSVRTFVSTERAPVALHESVAAPPEPDTTNILPIHQTTDATFTQIASFALDSLHSSDATSDSGTLELAIWVPIVVTSAFVAVLICISCYYLRNESGRRNSGRQNPDNDVILNNLARSGIIEPQPARTVRRSRSRPLMQHPHNDPYQPDSIPLQDLPPLPPLPPLSPLSESIPRRLLPTSTAARIHPRHPRAHPRQDPGPSSQNDDDSIRTVVNEPQEIESVDTRRSSFGDTRIVEPSSPLS
ncbi:hypothetical protein F5Y07DRAFT_401135 [Xylaria sp. FL0933]|nr:hypothetical protein F5Y07DRAFT_401135 [Xylaria sp. FL0933]